jgi:xanthine dehydrogenase accessory factor
MTRQYNTWKFIYDNLQAGREIVLLYVLESKGSSPGRQGFFMGINDKGEMDGSIGGGIMEHKFVEMAKDLLHNPPGKAGYSNIRKQIHDKSAATNRSGMICSGEQTIFLYKLEKKDEDPISKLLAALEDPKQGALTLSPEGIMFQTSIPTFDFDFKIHTADDWVYRERTGFRQELFIIGGGHCSLALSALMRTLGFYIRVYDDRKDLKTMEQNKYAHEKHLVEDYSELREKLQGGKDQYLVIMTFGFRTDDIAVRAILGKPFRYIGLLGSRTKVNEMFHQYTIDSLPIDWLQQIKAPIGLPIHSQTPEEIAVSIAAEIISIKNG